MTNNNYAVSKAWIVSIAKDMALRYGVVGISDIRLNTEANGIEFVLATGDVVNVPFGANEMPFNDSVSTTPTAILTNYNNYIFSNAGITTLGITLSSGYSAGFMSKVVFINPSSTPVITVTNTGSYTLKYKGDGVTGNVYTPTANTTATMKFDYDGINMNIYISEV